LFTLEDSNLSDMSQPAATVPATSVPGSPSSVPQPSAASTPSPILGEAVIPLVNKLQDIFSQLGSASTIDLPQVRILVPSMFTNNCIRICRT
jgi:dynamin 1-like protein